MKNKFYAWKTFLLVMCALATIAFGDIVCGEPLVQGVSGEIINGNTLVVNGIGFGIRADFGGTDQYLNYLFEDCEAGVITRNPKWLAGGYGTMVSNNNKVGSDYSVFHERKLTSKAYTNVFGDIVTSSTRYGIKTDVHDIAPVHNYFVSQWMRLSDDFGSIDGSSNQVKFLMTTPYASDLTFGKKYFSTAGWTDPPRLYTVTESGELSHDHGFITDYMPYGTWHRIDIWVSIPDATTGMVDEIKWWIDGQLIRTGKLTDGYLQDSPEDINEIGLVSFVGFIANTNDASFSLQTDDHFLDFTMARVEISACPIWDDTIQVHKEIQLPISWTDSSISVKANLSAFEENTPLYMYVISSSGTVNFTGFPLQGGSSMVPAILQMNVN